MEFVIAAAAVLALAVVIVLVGTGGRPMVLISATGDVFSIVARNRVPLAWTGLCVVLVAGFLFFFYAPPGFRMGPEQPIAFSHRLHAGVKAISCEFCHPYVGRSIHPGLPPVEKCLYCHNYIIAGHPQILKEHNYFNTGTPTPWRKVFYLAEHVLFNHQRHIQKQVACQSCHGAVETEDRLKGVRFKMGFCIECHERKGANVGCWLACHS